jgi:hypothetical protein
MTMLRIHEEALRGISPAFHEFLLTYKAHANIVYGIIEGREDPMFYRGLIEHHLPSGWDVVLIPAGRKRNVLDALAAFDWTRYSPQRVCFFVDRDLSHFLPGREVLAENLYITDNYSIENDVTNFGVFRRILEEVLGIANLTPTEAEIVERRFNSALTFFQNAMAPIMAQVIAWRRDGNRPCLDQIRPKDFFMFDQGEIRLRAQLSATSCRVQHAARCVDLPVSDIRDLNQIEATFRQRQGAERFIRGKYLLWFLIEYALDVHRCVAAIVTRFTQPPKVRVSIGAGNAMTVVAPRARCPSTLREFLARTFEKYIQETVCQQAHTGGTSGESEVLPLP